MIPGSWTFQQDLLNDVTSSQTYQFTFYELRILIISNVVGISSGDLINVEVWILKFEYIFGLFLKTATKLLTNKISSLSLEQ